MSNLLLSMALGMSIICLLLSIGAIVFSFLSYSEIIGMKKSTHKIEWVPVDQQDSADLTKTEKDEVRKMHEYLNGVQEDY